VPCSPADGVAGLHTPANWPPCFSRCALVHDASLDSGETTTRRRCIFYNWCQANVGAGLLLSRYLLSRYRGSSRAPSLCVADTPRPGLDAVRP
jgi:hypothetical protein